MSANNEYASCEYLLPAASNLEIQFIAPGVSVSSITIENIGQALGYVPDWVRNAVVPNFIRIAVEYKTDSWDPYSEVARYTRPTLLTILGILSFVFKRPFLVRSDDFGGAIRASHSISVPLLPRAIDVRACKDGSIDLSEPLRVLISSVFGEQEETKRLTVSLLDRFRRGLHLEKSTADGVALQDEAFLSFYSVLELLGETVKNKQLEEASKLCSEPVAEALRSVWLLTGTDLISAEKSLTKKVTALMRESIGGSVGARVRYFLNSYNLLDDQTDALLGKLVKIRNSIAHGKHVYRDALSWPLPDFFPVHAETANYLNAVKTLSGVSIGAHLRCALWDTDWYALKSDIFPSRDRIKRFIEQRQYEGLTTSNFLNGDCDHVTPNALVMSFLEKSITLEDLEQSLSDFLVNADLPKERMDEILSAGAILADSNNLKLSERCKMLISDWSLSHLVRDTYTYLLYRGHTCKWLTEHLRDRII